ncbi:MAG: hypothetical protein DCC55_11345 [Chloroflexi bacterium]|nr:MAG: hypothetical protein DCC55_11345 [Chloroflexota bacterium]
MAKRAEEKAQVVGLRYIGEGAYLPHVPARDLTAAEMEQYQVLLDEARAAGTFERLYQPVYEAQSEVSDG